MSHLGPIIDVHAHMYPASLLATLDAISVDTSAHRGLGAGDSAAETTARLEMMDSSGVHTQILSVAPLVPALEHPEAAAALAASANDRLTEIAAEHPSRFALLACLPLPHVDAALTELDRVVNREQVVGVSLTSSSADRLVSDPSFDPLWEELDHRRAVVSMHPAGCAACSPLIREENLTWMVGAPTEDTLVVASLIARGHVARYPKVRIIHPHLGGAVPLLLERWNGLRGFEAPDCPIAPIEAARRMWYDTVTHGSVSALRVASEVLGSDHLLFGTDFPYQRGDHYRQALAYVASSGLPTNAVHAICGRTAAHLLGEAPAP